MAGTIETFANISAQDLLRSGFRYYGWVRKADSTGIRKMLHTRCKYISQEAKTSSTSMVRWIIPPWDKSKFGTWIIPGKPGSETQKDFPASLYDHEKNRIGTNVNHKSLVNSVYLFVGPWRFMILSTGCLYLYEDSQDKTFCEKFTLEKYRYLCFYVPTIM